MLSGSVRLTLLAAGAVILAGCRNEQRTRPAPPDLPAPATAGGQVARGWSDSLSALADRDRVLGDSSAALWVIIASDFQCPHCQRWHRESFHALREDYVRTRKVKVAFVNFPLPIHDNAFPAAEAAMCAGVQGKFWAMHDAMFDSHTSWADAPDPRPRFTVLARQVGVVLEPWTSCVETHALRPLIEGDHARMRSAGIQATPSFFIGNRMMAGAQPYDSLRKLIELELRSAARPY